MHALQRALIAAIADDHAPSTILLLEHDETITVGRKRDAANNVLNADGVPVVEVERGGDVTWHGPGQLVAYPLLKLGEGRQDLHRHLRGLEDAVIDLLAGLGAAGHRDPRNTGVWLGDGEAAKKVCSVGIAARRWVTWHGLALNVTTDLTRFARIHPCGFDAGIMTSLQEVGVVAEVHALVPALGAALVRSLDLDWDGTITTVPEKEPLEGLLPTTNA